MDIALSNPLLRDWQTPHGIPPFGEIEDAHYEPAFCEAFEQHAREIAAIAGSSEEPDFDNTVAALERAGQLLDRVWLLFNNLSSSDSTESLQKIETDIKPRYARHMSDIFTRQDLYARLKAIHGTRDSLRPEQALLVEALCQRCVRAGAALAETERKAVQSIDEELAALETHFSQNVLNDSNEFELLLDSAEDVAGLPASVLHAAAAEAAARGKTGYLFTISRSSITPFLQFAERRDLRERMYRAYTNCGNNDNANNNQAILGRIAQLRAQRATLMGYASHAHFMLDDRMAATPAQVTQLLDKVWLPARERAVQEARDLQRRADMDGAGFELAAWDWWYYTEKLRQERFELDDEALKCYFSLDNVRDGAFDVARQLYGIEFRETDVPVYHPEVQSYEVRESDGSLIGIFMVDYFMRSSKCGGAWMSSFRDQSNLDGEVYPIVINCCNFPKPDGDSPSLLGMDEVRTLFHEFGHGLHGLLSRVTYPSQSGTNVKQDFVELPSQIMEHWAIEPQVLRSYARHFESGEVIPEALIDKLRATKSFNQGFATSEYLAACYLDMAWHTLSDTSAPSAADIEHSVMTTLDMPPAIDPRYKSSYFQHIFAGSDYSAGYYSYIWAAVLDADGYEAFRDAGIFDTETARAFRSNILEKGSSGPPMELFREFRGRDPEVTALLTDRGLA